MVSASAKQGYITSPRPGVESDLSTGSVPRTGLVVLGMHRSGTSALAHLCGKLGCALPRTLVGADDRFNPLGHFESQPVIDYNDRLLASLGTDWTRFEDLVSDDLDAAVLARSEEAAAILDHEFGTPGSFVLKDPRLCRLLPLWIAAIERCGALPRLICTTRAPGDVAASLAARNGFTPAYGELLWLRYVLDAERFGRGHPRHYLNFERLLEDPAGVAHRICRGLSLPPPEFDDPDREFGDAVQRRFRNHDRVPISSRGIAADWVSTVAEIMERWGAIGEDRRDYATLDVVWEAFAEACIAFGPLMSTGADAGRVRALDRQVAGLQQMIDTFLGFASDRLLRESSLFDPTWYAERNSAELTGNIDPVGHYLRRGASIGLDPGPMFSTRLYLEAYADVKAAGTNPLVHFLAYGRSEGRKTFLPSS